MGRVVERLGTLQSLDRGKEKENIKIDKKRGKEEVTFRES